MKLKMTIQKLEIKVEKEVVTPDPIWVGLAVNDDNGNDTGYVSAIHFGEHLHLEGDSMNLGYPNPRWSLLNDHTMRFSRRQFEIKKHATWVGNMVWDAVLMDIDEAQRLAEYVRGLDKFTCESGYSDVFDAWKSGAPIVFSESEDSND